MEKPSQVNPCESHDTQTEHEVSEQETQMDTIVDEGSTQTEYEVTEQETQMETILDEEETQTEYLVSEQETQMDTIVDEEETQTEYEVSVQETQIYTTQRDYEQQTEYEISEQSTQMDLAVNDEGTQYEQLESHIDTIFNDEETQTVVANMGVQILDIVDKQSEVQIKESSDTQTDQNCSEQNTQTENWKDISDVIEIATYTRVIGDEPQLDSPCHASTCTEPQTLVVSERLDLCSLPGVTEDAERNAKQAYLKEQIIDAGLEPADFIDYCSKDQEPDIDNWTFEQLQDLVRAFKDHIQEKVVIEIEEELEEKDPLQETLSHPQLEEAVVAVETTNYRRQSKQNFLAS